MRKNVYIPNRLLEGTEDLHPCWKSGGRGLNTPVTPASRGGKRSSNYDQKLSIVFRERVSERGVTIQFEKAERKHIRKQYIE